MDRDLVKILGIDVDSFTFDEAVNWAYSNHGQIVTINPEMIPVQIQVLILLML